MQAKKMVLAMAAVLLIAQSVNASVLSLSVSNVFAAATPPADAGPWCTATFDDHGVSGSVTLTLTTGNLSGAEFVSDWAFNLDPTLNPANLVFSAPIKAGLFDDPKITKGADACKADGVGDFDILLEFATRNKDNVRFEAGDTIQYVITGIPSLTANSFAFYTTPASQKPEITTVHIQGITSGSTTTSAWTVVPEPATLSLLALGGLALLRRNRK